MIESLVDRCPLLARPSISARTRSSAASGWLLGPGAEGSMKETKLSMPATTKLGNTWGEASVKDRQQEN